MAGDFRRQGDAALRKEALLHRALDGKVQLRQLVGFRQVVESPKFHRRNGGIDIAVAGEDDDFQLRIEGFQAFEQLDAVDAGHLDVRQYDLDTCGLGPPRRASSPSAAVLTR